MLVGFTGVTVMETNAAGVIMVDPEMFPEVAVMVDEPAATAVASPFVPWELLMAAIPASDELHVTEVVKSRAVWSEKVPTALNCTVVPGAMLALTGVTEMELNVTGGNGAPPPHPARMQTIVSRTRKTFVMLSLSLFDYSRLEWPEIGPPEIVQTDFHERILLYRTRSARKTMIFASNPTMTGFSRLFFSSLSAGIRQKYCILNHCGFRESRKTVTANLSG
jgi:hypothetical protein